MKKFFQKMLLITFITTMFMLVNPTNANAALQANPNTHYTKEVGAIEWISWFREMEKTGQAMGLNEELDTDLKPKQ